MKEKNFNKLLLSVRQATEHARNGTTTLSEKDMEEFLEMLKEEELNDKMEKALRNHNHMIKNNDTN